MVNELEQRPHPSHHRNTLISSLLSFLVGVPMVLVLAGQGPERLQRLAADWTWTWLAVATAALFGPIAWLTWRSHRARCLECGAVIGNSGRDRGQLLFQCDACAIIWTSRDHTRH